MSDRSPDSSTVVATASGEAANGQARSPWGTVLRAGGTYVLGVVVGVVVWVLLPVLISMSVMDHYNPGQVLGEAPLWFSHVSWLIPFAGSALGVFAIAWGERGGLIPALRPDPATVWAVRSMLAVGGALSVVAVFAEGRGFALFYWIAGGMIVTLAIRALGLGLLTQTLASLSMVPIVFPGWMLLLGGIGNVDERRIPAFVEPSAAVLGCLLFGSLLLASRRPEVRRASRGAAEITRPVSEPTGRFYYLGPDDEPVGPVSWEVLSQLRRAGAVTAETFVAREGEENWETCARHASLSEREAD